MSWLRRKTGAEPPPPASPQDRTGGRVERPTRGIATLLAGVGQQRRHSVLDLGPATNSSLQVYSRFARWVRFADLLSATSSEAELGSVLASIPDHPERRYDVLLAWNLFDRVPPGLRAEVASRLAALSSRDARLYLVVEPAGDGPRLPLCFGLSDVDRMWYETSGPPITPWPPVLPAELERLIAPFHVTSAYTTQVGLREYVATRGDG